MWPERKSQVERPEASVQGPDTVIAENTPPSSPELRSRLQPNFSSQQKRTFVCFALSPGSSGKVRLKLAAAPCSVPRWERGSRGAEHPPQQQQVMRRWVICHRAYSR